MVSIENLMTKKDEEVNKIPLGLFNEIKKISRQQLTHALASPDEPKWKLFVDDEDMKLYKMELEIDGIPVDPLKAILFVKVIFINLINTTRLNDDIICNF